MTLRPLPLSHAASLLVVACLSAPHTARAGGVTSADGHILTELVTAAASSVAGVNVLSQSDVRTALAVEGEKAEMGACVEDMQACIADVAGAMDARVVLFGDLGTLGELTVLTLNLYDSSSAQSAGRAVLREQSVTAVGEKVDGKVKELLRQWLASQTAGAAPRVLVLDLKVAGVAAETSPATPSSPPWLAVAGGGAAVVGATAVVLGALLDIDITTRIDPALRDRTVTQVQAQQLLLDRSGSAMLSLTGYIAGGVLLAGGAGMVAWDLSTE